MIRSYFKYAGTTVGFGSTQNSAWAKLKSQRAAMANNLASAQSTLNSITSSFSSAQQDNITGLGTLAANAAIARVRADAKAKAATLTAQIDSAQSALNDAKSVSSKPKFVSWALPSTAVDTTV
ncbi:MAG: hypothetical protein B7Y70_14325 [Rhizobiales bacterium 35-68-8]|nr:MAG: hypothetical protein B7Y70_14325 [Rhizobiales bacterium 35-68-8]